MARVTNEDFLRDTCMEPNVIHTQEQIDNLLAARANVSTPEVFAGLILPSESSI